MKIFYNILTLTVWQGSLYLIPLILTPYLARRLGVDQFGVLSLAGAIVGYVSLLVDWGFSISANKTAAQCAGRPDELRCLYWSVVYAKISLSLLAAILLGIISLNLRSDNNVEAVVLIMLLPVFVSVLDASWLLQGLERMGSFALSSLAGRLLTIPFTILLVHQPTDVVTAAAISGIGLLISTGASFFAANRIVPLWPAEFSQAGVWRQIKEGSHLFVSTAGISMYSQCNVLIVAAMTSVSEVGVYTGADKIRRAISGLTGPISTALFPRVNSLAVSDPGKAKKLVKLVLLAQGGGTLLLSFAQYFLAGPIVNIFLGPEFSGAIPVVKALSPIPFLVGLSNVLGMQILVPFGFSAVLARIVAASGGFNLLLLPTLCLFYGAVGAAISITCTEALVTAIMIIAIFRRRSNLFLGEPDYANVGRSALEAAARVGSDQVGPYVS